MTGSNTENELRKEFLRLEWQFFLMWPFKTKKRFIVMISRIGLRGIRRVKSSLVALRQISRDSQSPDRVRYRGSRPQPPRSIKLGTKTNNRIVNLFPKRFSITFPGSPY